MSFKGTPILLCMLLSSLLFINSGSATDFNKKAQYHQKKADHHFEREQHHEAKMEALPEGTAAHKAHGAASNAHAGAGISHMTAARQYREAAALKARGQQFQGHAQAAGLNGSQGESEGKTAEGLSKNAGK
jgi:hypothetical protein